MGAGYGACTKIKQTKQKLNINYCLCLYLSISHTHLERIKSNGAELVRVKKCVLRADLKVVIVAAFLMCDGRVPERRAKMREGTITFHLVFIEWKFQETGVSTGMKRSSRRLEMMDIREISRSR